MKKKLILLLVLIFSTTLYGCSSSTAKKNNAKTSNSIKIKYEAPSDKKSFALSDTSLTPSPFTFVEDTLVFPNWDDKDRISLIKGDLPNTYISKNDATSFFDYRTNSLTCSNNIAFFADTSKNYALSSLDTSNGTYTKLLDYSVSDLIFLDNTIYFINKSDGYTLYSYDLSTKKPCKLTSDKVGKYLINDNSIIYQNVSDKSKLYRINLKGEERSAISTFAVDSFIINQNTIIAINSYDDHSLYSISPTDLKETRIAFLNGKDLKESNDKVYYLNRDTCHLNSLSIDLEKPSVSTKEIYTEGINDYYPTTDYIFAKKSVNINNTYIYIIKN